MSYRKKVEWITVGMQLAISKGPVVRSPGHTAWRVTWLIFSVLVRCLWAEPVNDRKNCTSPRSPSLSASSQSWTVSTHLPWHRKRENCETKKLCLWIRIAYIWGKSTNKIPNWSKFPPVPKPFYWMTCSYSAFSTNLIINLQFWKKQMNNFYMIY